MRFAILIAVTAVAVAGVRPARADDAVRYRPDLISVRLTAAAASSLRAAMPRGGAATQRWMPESGSLGMLSRELGLSLEPEFPAAPAAAGSASRATGAAERLERDWLVQVPNGLTPERALERLQAIPDVESAERVALVPVTSAPPNDSLWSKSFYLYQASRRDVHALEAWNITQGDSTAVIGIIDTGVLLAHPDLAANIYTNAAEANGLPGVDDDGNGYIDDVHGWDFVALPDTTFAVPGEDWRDEDNDANDFTGHGTGVAGVAAQLTNNHIGGAGAAPHARLMPLRVGYSARVAPSGLIDESAAARAIVYAARTGATVANCSFSSVPQTDVTDALDYAFERGLTVVVAAGNNGTPHAMNDRPDVISVAALDNNDRVAMFSSTGAFVDVSAAGQFLCTTTFDKLANTDSASRFVPGYTATASGTSLAAPLVAAEVALVQSNRHAHGLPPLDPLSMQARIVETADDISAQNPGSTGYGSGRVNFLRALTETVHSFAVTLDSPVVGSAAVGRSSAGEAFAVAGSRGGHLVRFDGEAQAIRWDVTLPGAPGGSPALIDLGGGRGAGIFVGLETGLVCGFDENGAALPGWPVAATCPGGGVSTPALADVDGDGAPDVVWGDANGRVWAWNTGGHAIDGAPYPLGGAASSVWIALADLDGDGIAEIVAATADGSLCVYPRDGLPAPGWPKRFAAGANVYLQYPPVVTRLSGEPNAAIVTLLDSGQDGFMSSMYANGGVRAYTAFNGRAAGSPAAADVDRDGRAEFLVYRSTEDVYYVGTGAYPPVSWTSGIATPASLTPELVVANGAAGAPVIDWTYRGSLLDIVGATGQQTPLQRCAGGTPTFADLDGDGMLEGLVSTGESPYLFVFSTGAPAAGNDRLWPTSRGNAARTGSTIAAAERLPDRMPPRAVMDLAATQVAPDSMRIEWTAPFEGHGGHAARYDIRTSASAPSDAGFSAGTPIAGVPLPAPAGTREHIDLAIPAGFEGGYVALVSADSAANASAVSNAAFMQKAHAPAIADLRVTSSADSTLSLGWTSLADAGWFGHVEHYTVYASTQPFDSTNFATASVRAEVPAAPPAGVAVTATLAHLRTGHRYWLATTAHYSYGGDSPLSAVVTGIPGVSVVTPHAVTDLIATGTDPTSIELRWTSTGNDGFLGHAATYEIRGSEQPIDATNFTAATLQRVLAATRPLGLQEASLFTSLFPGRHYWFAVRAQDSLGLVSPISNIATTAPPLPGRPSAIQDLRISNATTSAITLVWAAIGTAGTQGRVASYDVHASAHAMTAASFDAAEIQLTASATQAQGQPEYAVLSSLVAGQRYWLGVRTRDEFGFVSDVSNIASALAAPFVTPVAVSDLRITSIGAVSVGLTWTSTGTNGHGGHAASYELHASSAALDESSFERADVRLHLASTQLAGRPQQAIVTGLVPGRQYWIAVEAVDSVGITSALSNVVSSIPGPLAGRAGAGIAASPSPARAPVALMWQADAASATRAPRVQVLDITGRICRTLPATAGAGGVVHWDGADDSGTAMPAGIYFARMTTVTGTATSRFVLLR